MNPGSLGNRMNASRIPREVAALMAAIQLRDANRQALQQLTDGEWQSLLSFSDLAHLTLLLAQVERNGFPSWVIERLERNLADNAARFERVKATYKEAAAALDEAQIDFIALKGFTQSPDYVDNPRLRTQSDLDFYCPKEMVEPAKAALQAIGYRSEETLDYSRADHVPSMIRPGDWRWRGNAFDPDMPLSIELHFVLWNETITLFPVPEVDCFWERRTSRTIEDIAFPALAPLDHFGYLALHILRNMLAGDWVIHHVHELATFLHAHAKDDYLWQEWMGTQSSSLRMLEAIALFHAKAWFGCDVHKEIEAELTGLPSAIKAWLQGFAASSLEGMFRQNKHSVWLHTALLRSAKEKRLLLRRALIPTRMSRMGSPAIGLKNRRTRNVGWLNRYGQYTSYVASRLTTHARMVPETLWRGLGWWVSQRQIGKQF